MRVIEVKPGLLHAFIDQAEREHIQADDECGRWLHNVILTLVAENAVENNRPCIIRTFLRKNPNTPNAP